MSMTVNTLNGDFGKLDAMDYDALVRYVVADIKKSEHGFTEELADMLDMLFTVKFVRLMRTPSIPAQAVLALDGVIARINRDSYRAQLNAYLPHYAARWQMLSDAISAYLRIEEANRDVLATEAPERRPGAADPWELVVEQVLLKEHDVTWSSIKELLRARGVGPQSGGGVSQLISAMRAQGWVDAVQLRGNKSVLVPGKNISQSQTWLTRHVPAPMDMSLAPSREVEHGSHSSYKFAEFLRRGTTFNQAALLDFMHVAHEHHRTMRLELERLKSSGSTTSDSLFKAALGMNHMLSRRTICAAKQNFELLGQYFHDGRPLPPRMSLVMNCQREHDDAILTYAIARDSSVDYQSCGARITENSGFEHVITRGTYYLNNDIPSSILDGSYVNPRFDGEYVEHLRKEYAMCGMDDPGRVKLGDWHRIWKEDNSSDVRSFYKSTLIVPIALRTEFLSNEFSSLLRQRLALYLDDKHHEPASQLILGFLCFDHPRVDYFNVEKDVEVAHVFASLLSMYLFNRIMLTDLSTTYHECLGRFSEKRRKRVQHALLDFTDTLSPRDISFPSFDLAATTSSALFRMRDVPA